MAQRTMTLLPAPKLCFTMAPEYSGAEPKRFTICQRCLNRLLATLPLNPRKETVTPTPDTATPCTICLDYVPPMLSRDELLSTP